MKSLTEKQIRKIIIDAMQKGYELHSEYSNAEDKQKAYKKFVSEQNQYTDKVLKEI